MTHAPGECRCGAKNSFTKKIDMRRGYFSFYVHGGRMKNKYFICSNTSTNYAIISSGGGGDVPL